MTPEERQERRSASRKRYRQKFVDARRAKRLAQGKPVASEAYREACSKRNLAFWTPENRAAASFDAKERHRKRRLWLAQYQAEDEGWPFCEWPRWERWQDHPPGYDLQQREWLLMQAMGHAELLRWRKAVSS